jgi:long-chain fatty acid transport protein
MHRARSPSPPSVRPRARRSPLAGAGAALAGACVATQPGPAQAGGYALIGQSAASAGTAYAGASALAGGADTAWYNPAGLGFLREAMASGSADFLLPRGDYDDAGSTNVLGAPRRGASVDGAAFGVVPSAYLVLPAAERLTFGLSLNAPYGQKTEYASDFIGRYEALTSELTAVNVGLGAGYRAAGWLAVGGGLDLLYARTTLSNAVDFGAVCLAVAGPACAGLGLSPEGADGRVEIDGDALAVGFNLGVMADLGATRIGLHHRAPIDADIEGDADFTVPDAAAALATATGAFSDTGAATTLRFPASVSLGVAHDVTPRLTLMGQAIWTDWSSVDRTVVRFDNPGQPDATLRTAWRDSVYVGLGGAWRYDESLTLRAGVGYDQTPVTDDLRTPRLPGADTVSLAVGVGWRPTAAWSVDAAYQRFFYDDAPIDITSAESGRLAGSVSNTADVLSLQATLRF